jgi:Glycosyl transferase family 11
MITNGIFGEASGRLGNQLFQLGLLFAIRERHGHEFYLPHAGESLWGCFDLDVPSAGPECQRVFHERNGSCNFHPGVFDQPDGTSFHGYFQSYRYLEGCREDLIRFLRFNADHLAWSQALLHAYRRRHKGPLVSVHVRRSDYVHPGAEHAWGNLAADGYYERAAASLGDDVTYLVFSDDIAWCRRSLELERAEFVDLDHGTSLAVMAGCDVNIVANSTYSWWGAYLNPAADVYAPSRWFGPAMPPPNDRQEDIVPPNWRTIPVFGDALPASRALDRAPHT